MSYAQGNIVFVNNTTLPTPPPPAITGAENGLSVVSNKVRLGGQLITGLTNNIYSLDTIGGTSLNFIFGGTNPSDQNSFTQFRLTRFSIESVLLKSGTKFNVYRQSSSINYYTLITAWYDNDYIQIGNSNNTNARMTLNEPNFEFQAYDGMGCALIMGNRGDGTRTTRLRIPDDSGASVSNVSFEYGSTGATFLLSDKEKTTFNCETVFQVKIGVWGSGVEHFRTDSQGITTSYISQSSAGAGGAKFLIKPKATGSLTLDAVNYIPINLDGVDYKIALVN